MSPPQELRSAVYRKPARERPFLERMLMLTGEVLDTYEWKYHSQSEQSTSKRKRSKLRTPAAARAEYEAKLAALDAEGWRPVENWPGNASPVLPSAAISAQAPKEAIASAKPKPKPRPKPKPVTKLELSGSAPKVRPAALTPLAKILQPLPQDWVTLLTTHGARMFGRRLRVHPPAKVLKETRAWVKFWVVDHAPVWRNFASLVPDAKRLLLLGASIDGDAFGFAAGPKPGYVVFPRSQDEAVGLKTLAEVFGWFLASATQAGDTARPTYAPER